MCCLRATRDKLPRGLYSVSVAIHSHLGGPALPLYSENEKQTWRVTTEPTDHRGRIYDIDLHINQSLLMVVMTLACINSNYWDIALNWVMGRSNSHVFRNIKW